MSSTQAVAKLYLMTAEDMNSLPDKESYTLHENVEVRLGDDTFYGTASNLTPEEWMANNPMGSCGKILFYTRVEYLEAP